MTRLIHAELLRLVRRRTLVALVASAVVFAVVSALTVFSAARSVGVPGRRGGPSLAALTGHGGGTEAFAIGASFAGLFVFVTVIALVAAEFTGGTFRATLLREPRRVRVIAGKLTAILLLAAASVALMEVVTFLASLVVAPSKDVSTSEWFSQASAGDAARDFGAVYAGVAGWAVLGTMLAVIFRSSTVAVAVGFAWAGPFENITSASWSTGLRVFPGQVLASLVRGGTADLGLSRALLTAAAYSLVALAVTFSLVARRDVTA
jgi:ABC-type transport system involved in multi-copper enzyme maturation permease subunit